MPVLHVMRNNKVDRKNDVTGEFSYKGVHIRPDMIGRKKIKDQKPLVVHSGLSERAPALLPPDWTLTAIRETRCGFGVIQR